MSQTETEIIIPEGQELTKSTKETRIDLYEAMFLMGTELTANAKEAIALVESILTKADAEIIVLSKWDERRLAYPIRGQKRGLYLICYARVDRSKLSQIERDCNLNEQIVRQMFIRADHMGEVELEEAIKQSKVAATAVQLQDEGAAPAPQAEKTEENATKTETKLDNDSKPAETE